MTKGSSFCQMIALTSLQHRILFLRSAVARKRPFSLQSRLKTQQIDTHKTQKKTSASSCLFNLPNGSRWTSLSSAHIMGRLVSDLPCLRTSCMPITWLATRIYYISSSLKFVTTLLAWETPRGRMRGRIPKTDASTPANSQCVHTKERRQIKHKSVVVVVVVIVVVVVVVVCSARRDASWFVSPAVAPVKSVSLCVGWF